MNKSMVFLSPHCCECAFVSARGILVSTVSLMLVAAVCFIVSKKRDSAASPQIVPPPITNTTSLARVVIVDVTTEKNSAVAEAQTNFSRFPASFLPEREEAIKNAAMWLDQAEAAITDFGDSGLNQRVVDYQKLSRNLFDAVKSDDQPKIRQLTLRQADAFPAMTRLVAPLSVANRENFNKYFFAIGPAWADLLQACAGADLPTKDSPPVYPSGFEPPQNPPQANP